MAKPTTFRGTSLLIKLGDGATPTEAFDFPCGLTTNGLNRSGETNDVTVPDCDDPDAPAWTEREVSTMSWEASGSGILAAESVEVWDDWFSSGIAKNVQVDVGSVGTGRRYTGRALLTSYNITGERGQKVTVEVTISGDGELVAADLT
ncbi:phage tail tube protein [Xanthobacter autotrophicus]|uniref:phage tail tube protein n=1 Tax=Xanthobacter autotrophicus TaxID=280 RepID=UPI00372BA9F9